MGGAVCLEDRFLDAIHPSLFSLIVLSHLLSILSQVICLGGVAICLSEELEDMPEAACGQHACVCDDLGLTNLESEGSSQVPSVLFSSTCTNQLHPSSASGAKHRGWLHGCSPSGMLNKRTLSGSKFQTRTTKYFPALSTYLERSTKICSP